jgi:hypothetical protein
MRKRRDATMQKKLCSARQVVAGAATLLTLFPVATLPAAPVRTEYGLVPGLAEPGLTVNRGFPFAAPPTAIFAGGHCYSQRRGTAFATRRNAHPIPISPGGANRKAR